ncbi:MAG: transposase, partial [Terracidiphilus sp.]
MRQEILTSQEGSERFARKSERELFLDRMDQVLPWGELLALVESYDPPAAMGPPPAGLSILLRAYLVQQWFKLSDPSVEEALYESPMLRNFVGVDLSVAPAPDETAIRDFRQMLEEHDLGGKMMVTVNHYLDERGMRITSQANLDAASPNAPSSAMVSVGGQMQPGGEGGQHPAASKAGGMGKVETPVLVAGGLSVAVISPDTRRRNAAMGALDDCQAGRVQEFVAYPPDLNEVPRMLGQDFDVVLVDLDSNSKQALDLVETISVHGLAT